MQTINLELSKRLSEGGYLDNINTEYYLDSRYWTILDRDQRQYIEQEYWLKTLTLEEAIEFLPKRIWNYHLQLNLYWDISDIRYVSAGYSLYGIEIETLLLAIENMLVYLLDSNLLTKK
jgi:hypothetical protein